MQNKKNKIKQWKSLMIFKSQSTATKGYDNKKGKKCEVDQMWWLVSQSQWRKKRPKVKCLHK